MVMEMNDVYFKQGLDGCIVSMKIVDGEGIVMFAGQEN